MRISDWSSDVCSSDLQEQDHMVAGLDHGAVMGDEHLFVADDRADGGAWRQAEVADGLADDFAGLGIAMGNRLDGFGRATAQGVYADDVAAPHVGQQGADGCPLRADGDLDLAALDQVDIGDRKIPSLTSSHYCSSRVSSS